MSDVRNDPAAKSLLDNNIPALHNVAQHMKSDTYAKSAGKRTDRHFAIAALRAANFR